MAQKFLSKRSLNLFKACSTGKRASKAERHGTGALNIRDCFSQKKKRNVTLNRARNVADTQVRLSLNGRETTVPY